MRQQHRLCSLQVRVPGNNDFAMRFGKLEEGSLRVTNKSIEFVNRSPHPQTEIRRYLIVTTTSGVQLATQITGRLDQSSLDKRVHVFRRRVVQVITVSAAFFEDGVERSANLSS